MHSKEFISINDYSYELPDYRIAKYPLPKRDQSKLLEFQNGEIREILFKQLPEILPPESLLLVNNTKVIHARLLFRRKTGAIIEVFCISPHEPADYQLALSSTVSCSWNCIVGNLKKWKDDILELQFKKKDQTYTLKAEKQKSENGKIIVCFSWNEAISFSEVIEFAGKVPIPPYLKRDAEQIDNERYQTVYSTYEGSVAAPTAGFHFTPEIINQLKKKRIQMHNITLHVGTGTFQPVKSGNALEHKMHEEHFSVDLDTLKALVQNKKPVIVTGTTTLRALESVYWLALKSIRDNKIITHLNQWEHNSINPNIPLKKALEKLLILMEEQNLKSLSAITEIMIVPGYQFHAVDMLITNFHQPRSTLLLLVAAFIGDDWKKVYQYALNNDFRFLSYGDSSLLHR